MFDFEYSFKLGMTISDLEKQIQTELSRALKAQGLDVNLISSETREGIKKIIRESLRSHPTFKSLIDGELWAELGLPMKARLWASTTMLDIISDGVEIVTKIAGMNPVTIELDIMWSNEQMLDLINNGFASYISQNIRKGTKYQIPWLEWLVEGGSSILVQNFHIEYGDFPHSRSGQAHMIEGGEWSVPSQYQGVLSDNFITQSINRSIPKVVQYIMSKFS